MFFELGPARVTMDLIAGELGVSKKTLYRHFSSKSALLRECLLAEFAGVRSGIEAILNDSCSGSITKLESIMAFLMTAGPRPSRAFAADILRTAPELWRELEERRRGLLQQSFSRLFQEAAAEGVLRPDLHPGILLPALLALVDGVAQPRMLAELPMTAGQVLRELLRLLSLGILSDQGRQAFSNQTLPSGTKVTETLSAEPAPLPGDQDSAEKKT